MSVSTSAQVRELARRSITQTLRQPANVIPLNGARRASRISGSSGAPTVAPPSGRRGSATRVSCTWSSTGWAADHAAVYSLLASIAIIAIFLPLAVGRYRRVASR